MCEKFKNDNEYFKIEWAIFSKLFPVYAKNYTVARPLLSWMTIPVDQLGRGPLKSISGASRNSAMAHAYENIFTLEALAAVSEIAFD